MHIAFHSLCDCRREFSAHRLSVPGVAGLYMKMGARQKQQPTFHWLLLWPDLSYPQIPKTFLEVSRGCLTIPRMSTYL